MKMNERKLKYLFILLISIITLLSTNVYAASACFNASTKDDSDIYYEGDPAKRHHNYNIVVNWNGKEYKGYCADYDIDLPQCGKDDSNYTCEEKDDATIGYILGSNLPDNAKTVALRAFYHPNMEIGGSGAKVGLDLAAAAQNASGGTLTFTQASASGATVTYNVTSNAPLTNVDFTCDSNCTMGNKTWNDTSGSVTVTATKGCSFTITATYDGVAGASQGSKILECTKDQNQTLYVTINEGSTGGNSSGNSSSTGKVSQKFTGSITSGSYYEQYCKDKENDNDKCNEQTTLHKDPYCDISGNKITIESPKNVQYCILNNKDEAGNTYEMDDNQLGYDNPYCAVYCKEDYEMSLPGAKYTDSGRYFELENTVVTATRTCYATNPDGDSDHPGMNLKKFVEDIIKAQLDLLEARDKYIKAVEEKRLAENPITHVATACGKKYGTNFEIKSTAYIGVEYEDKNICDPETGECKIQYPTHNTDSYSWGTFVDEEEDEDNNNACKAGSPHTEPEPNWQEHIDTAKANMQRAQKALEDIITYIEKCYKWVNNLCLNPEVLFDYNEQYSSDINYTLVSGGGTFTGTDAKYIEGENLPDNQYKANSSGGLQDHIYVHCDEKGCDRTTNIAKQISTLKEKLYYRSIEVTGTAEYANIQEFQTNYPHGTIDAIPEGAEVHKNYSYLGAVFPVALNTKTGVYQWTLNFSNLGMYNNEPSCKNGRLDDVLAATNQTTSLGIDYVCVYVVDCDDCDYECVGDYCYYEDEEEKCPECDVYCTNCIFDGDGFTYNYEVVSVNDINPNERAMGSNWTGEKGQKALASIEDAAETAYEQPQYVITLNPNNMKEIRDYNKETDTYVAQDLDYHTKNDIQNAYGTSSFLRDEKNQRKFFKEIKLNNDWELWTSVDKANHVGPAFK